MSEIADPEALARAGPIRPNTLVSDLLLAILATCGFFYVNIMAVMVDALIAQRGFTEQQAGMVQAFNVYGAVAGSAVALLLASRVEWRRASLVMILALIAIDLASMAIATPWPLIAMRSLHGLVSGCLVGLSYSVISRVRSPDRTYGVLLLLQYGAAGVVIWFVPELVREVGAWVAFAVLICFSGLTLAILPLIPGHVREPVPATGGRAGRMPPWALAAIVLALCAIVPFQAANMALAAFSIPLGQHYGLGLGDTSRALGASGWVAMLGAALVVVVTTRFGRTLPVILGMTLLITSTWAFHFSESLTVYFWACSLSGVAWGFTVCYFMGICAALDRSGRSATLSGLASKIGLATGPLAGGMLLGNQDYAWLIDVTVIVLFIAALPGTVGAAFADHAQRA